MFETLYLSVSGDLELSRWLHVCGTIAAALAARRDGYLNKKKDPHSVDRLLEKHSANPQLTWKKP